MATACLNCGETVSRNFCPACGQAAEAGRGPLVGMLGDFFSEFLSLDGRHVRTAVALGSPGRLTRMYLQGKRASYVRPARVYFVTSLLFFLLVGLPVPNADDFNVYVDDVLVGRTEPDPELGRLQLLKLDDSGWLGSRIRPYMEPRLTRLQGMQAQDLLDGFFSRLRRTVPSTLISFVPVLALVLKLLYIRRSWFYVDHLVFALHFQSFLFLVFVLARLANLAGLQLLIPAVLTYIAAFLLLVPTYLIVALKRVYSQSWAISIVKGILLALLYSLLIQPIVLFTVFLVVRAM